MSRSFRHLSKQQLAQASSRAINRSLEKGRTVARGVVKDEFNIPQNMVSERIGTKRAFPAFPVGKITASAKPVPMDAFSPKFETSGGGISVTRKGAQKTRDFKRKKKSPRQGVSIEVHKGRREVVPFAFMIKGAKPRVFARGQYEGGGGAFGFIRRNKRINSEGNDTPIKPLISTTVHAAVINNKAQQKISAPLLPYFEERYMHELNRLTDKMGK